ncbi:MAG: hypothetical protein QW334_00335 [Thermofilum sp.]
MDDEEACEKPDQQAGGGKMTEEGEKKLTSEQVMAAFTVIFMECEIMFESFGKNIFIIRNILRECWKLAERLTEMSIYQLEGRKNEEDEQAKICL